MVKAMEGFGDGAIAENGADVDETASVIDIETDENETDLNIDGPLFQVEENIPPLKPNLLKIVAKVRTVGSFFSRSGYAQDILADYCKEKDISITKMMVDVCTRWSSLHEMILSFNKLIPAIKSTFKKIDKQFEFSQEELDNLLELERILKYVVDAVKRISRENVNLAQCDIVLSMLISNLGGQKSHFSELLKNLLVTRINLRRTIWSDLCLFFNYTKEVQQKSYFYVEPH